MEEGSKDHQEDGGKSVARIIVKATYEVCSKCKYRVGFGAAPGKNQSNHNICCNYWKIMNHSRIFENGKKAYDPKYCDKFEVGEAMGFGAWTPDDMKVVFAKGGCDEKDFMDIANSSANSETWDGSVRRSRRDILQSADGQRDIEE